MPLAPAFPAARCHTPRVALTRHVTRPRSFGGAHHRAPPRRARRPARRARLAAVLGRSSAMLAVPEPARALAIAGLAGLSSRRPLVVAVPTTGGRAPGHDLPPTSAPTPSSCSRPGRRCPSSGSAPWSRRWAGACGRCGASASRRPTAPMARRSAGGGGRPGAGAGAAARPARGGRRAGRRPPGEQRDRDDLVAALVGAGYRREEVVEHRGELAVRGSIVDVFPSTADRPVRIDLWGDEVDRLTEFSVGDQRSTDDLRARHLRVPRAAPHRRGARAGRAARRPRAVGPRAVGAAGRRARSSTAWSPGCRGSPTASTCCSTWWATRPWSSCSSPAACATGPPTSWPRRPTWPPRSPTPGAPPRRGDERTSRASTSPSTGCSPTPTRRRGPSHRAREPRRRPGRGRRRGRRWSATPPACSRSSASWRPTATASWSAPTARARPPGWAPAVRRRHPGPRSTSPRSSGAASCPASKLAVLAEPDLTGRRRAHRRARPRKRDAEGFFDDLKAGDHVVHHQHGVARYGGMVKRAIGGVRARLPAARVQGRRQALRPVRPDRRGAPLHRRRRPAASAGSAATAGRRPRPRCGPRSPRSPRSWWCSTRSACTPPGHAFPSPTRRGSASSRTPSRTRRRPTSSRPSSR